MSPVSGRVVRAVALCAVALWTGAAPATAFSASPAGSLAVSGRASALTLRAAEGGASKPKPVAAWLRTRSSALVRYAQGTDAVRGGASEPNQPNKIMKVISLLTNLFPFWVLAGAGVGMFQPEMLKWLKGEYITAALASTMLFMGMTLEVRSIMHPVELLRVCFLGGVLWGRGTVWHRMVLSWRAVLASIMGITVY